METIQRLDFDSLDPYRYSLYKKMTAEKYRCYLDNRSPSTFENPVPLSFGMESEGEPIAVVHLTLHTQNKIGELDTFFIRDGYLFENSALKLLNYVEEAVKKTGCSFLSYMYEKQTLLSPAFIKNGWSTPRLFLIRFAFNNVTFHAPWMKRKYPLPDGYALFPWQELTQKERERLIEQEKEYRFHSSVSPFREENYLQPMNSLGIRYKDEVVGWMITHTFPETPETIRYSCLYIDSTLQFKGISMGLLQEAMRIQLAEGSYLWGECEVSIDLSESNWIRFLNQRLAPYCASITKTMQSVRELS